MEPHHLSSNWIRTIIGLLQKAEYVEVCALTEYFPKTPSRLMVQCAALIGLKKFDSATAILRQLSSEPRALASDFAYILRETDIDLISLGNEAINNDCLSLGYLCFESYLYIYPQEIQSPIDGLLALASRALKQGNFDLGYAGLERVAELDDSPGILIMCAEVAIANRQSESAQPLLKFAEKLIRRASSKTSDLEQRLRMAKLLAIDASTFPISCEMLRQITNSNESTISRIYEILLPLMDYKPYFGEIADFLLDISPRYVDLIAERLTINFQRKGNSAFLVKAQNLLHAMDYVGLGYSYQFVNAIIFVARESVDRELYIQRLLRIETTPEQSLEAAELLISSRTTNLILVSSLLRQTLKNSPDQRVKVIAAYVRLADLADDHQQTVVYTDFIKRAAELSTSLIEFLKYGVKKQLGSQLVMISRNDAVLRESFEYEQDEVNIHIHSLISEAKPIERRQALYKLMENHTHIHVDQLIFWVKALIDTDLALTADSLWSIASRITPLPSELQRIIESELLKQELRLPDLRRLAPSSEWSMTQAEYSELLSIRDLRLADKRLYQRAGAAMARSAMHNLMLTFSKGERKRKKKVPTKSHTHTVKLARHTRIDFPSECVIEHKVDLRIQLTREVPKKTRVQQELAINVKSGIKETTIIVNITAPEFAIQEYRKLLVMKVDEDSEEITFTLVPLELGEQVIEIEFFHESVRVGYVLVTTKVKSSSPTKAPPNVFVMESPVRGLKKVSAKGMNVQRRTLHTTWLGKDDKLSYTVYSPGCNESPEWEKPGPNIQGSVESYLQQLNEFLSEVVTQGDPTQEEWDSTLLNLQGIGKNLYKILIPTPLAEYLKQLKSGSSIIVSTNEQWIPWELIYDDEDFWGKKYVIAHLPRLSDRRNIPGANRPERKSVNKIKRIVNVIGGEVGVDESQRAKQLFNMIPSAHVDILQGQPISVLQKTLDKADVLHCTCHGHLDPYMLQISKDSSPLTNLLLQSVQKLPVKTGSLVFANTCTSALPMLTFGRFSSFAWEFYRHGASAFIGTLGAVPTNFALKFAEYVYSELFGNKSGATISQAVAAARKRAAKERNLFWLLYCIYGDPDYRAKA